MLLDEYKILGNKSLGAEHFEMVLEAPEIASRIKPGQFFSVQPRRGALPLFKRPFSLFDKTDTTISLLYRVVGSGTKVLSERLAGELVEVIGPQGSSFTIPEKGKVAIVAGGIGIAPFLELSRKLVAAGVEVDLLFGARDKTLLAGADRFENLGVNLKLFTDDGSAGEQGFPTEWLDDQLAEGTMYEMIYACGPTVMMKVAAFVAAKYGLKCEVSFEETMACSYGVCLGCVVKDKKGEYVRTCIDGPVVDAAKIEWGF